MCCYMVSPRSSDGRQEQCMLPLRRMNRSAFAYDNLTFHQPLVRLQTKGHGVCCFVYVFAEM
jgi:hypothetical protein